MSGKAQLIKIASLTATTGNTVQAVAKIEQTFTRLQQTTRRIEQSFLPNDILKQRAEWFKRLRICNYLKIKHFHFMPCMYPDCPVSG